MFIALTIISQISLCNVRSIDHRFPCKQIVSSHPCFFIFVFQFQGNRHPAIFQMCFYLLKEIKFFGSLFIHTCCLCNFGDSSFKNLKVWEDQFQIDGFNITKRINASIYMDHIGILKAAHYMNDRIYLTNVCKELISKSLSLGCSLYKSCNIHELDHSRCHFLWMIKIPEKLQSLIRDCNNAHIRINGTEWIVCWFRSCFCQWIK